MRGVEHEQVQAGGAAGQEPRCAAEQVLEFVWRSPPAAIALSTDGLARDQGVDGEPLSL